MPDEGHISTLKRMFGDPNRFRSNPADGTQCVEQMKILDEVHFGLVIEFGFDTIHLVAS